MLKLAIYSPSKCETFAALFQHIKHFTEHIQIMFETNRLFIQALDSSHISILEIHLPMTWFDKYELDGPAVIGIHASFFFQIMVAREKSQTITIEQQTNNDSLSIHFTSDSKLEFDKHFELNLLDIECEVLTIPAIDYQALFSLSSGHFASLIEQLRGFGDVLELDCCEEKITLFSNAPEKGKMSVNIEIDDLTTFAINEGERIQLSFGLNPLSNMCAYKKLTKNVEIGISDQFPMRIMYQLDKETVTVIADTSVPGSTPTSAPEEEESLGPRLVFYLAPQIRD